VLALLAALVAVASLADAVVATPAGSTARLPAARTFSGVPSVGALFSLTADGALGRHFCSASVVDSPHRDLVITAAHCVTGRVASRIAFVPDYARSTAPVGAWSVGRIYVDRAWVGDRNPDDDFAFLVVDRPETLEPIEQVTGGERLDLAASPTHVLEVIGYPDDLDRPITCTNRGRSFSPTQIEFACRGYTTGTSGAPLLLAARARGERAVIGVVGGYEEGGDTPAISYAARLAGAAGALYRAAAAARA